MSIINVDFINSASQSYVTVGTVSLPNTINIPTGASAGYVLTSNSVGDAYWTASTGYSQNLSQVLATGNQTSGNDIIVNDNDMVTFNGGSSIFLDDYSSLSSVNRVNTASI
jgi:hypothetical protein